MYPENKCYICQTRKQQVWKYRANFKICLYDQKFPDTIPETLCGKKQNLLQNKELHTSEKQELHISENQKTRFRNGMKMLARYGLGQATLNIFPLSANICSCKKHFCSISIYCADVKNLTISQILAQKEYHIADFTCHVE